MKELLVRLQKADPKCYDEIWQWALWLVDGEYGDYEEDYPGYIDHRNDVIQGCLQRAVIARGWGLHQRIFPEKNSYALIMGPNFMTKMEADSIVEALLAAYVTTVEGRT